jgi:hypothetical protein
MEYNLTSINVLKLIRDKKANDWSSLYGMFPLNTGTEYQLKEIIYQLYKLGLIDIHVDNNKRSFKIKGTISVSQRWIKIQNALRLSLTQISAAQSESKMLVNPIFGRPISLSKEIDVFVLMPFTNDLLPIYQDHVKKVVTELNLNVARADDFFTTNIILNDIWDAINNSKIIIADCTGRNPNVFYEIGIAHVVGKKVILITQNKDDVPFDLRHLRFFEYRYTPPGMIEFENTLKETLCTELK